MDETTPNLDLPYIMAAQAQKHVTHNEALRGLDAIVQLAVLDRDLSAPPPSPADGDRYIVGTSGTGDWAGHDNHIAAFQDNSWAFFVPVEGWLVWVSDEDKLLSWTGSAWDQVSADTSTIQSAALVGINTTADTGNRLSISSPASLFSHEGSDHRIKVNKAAVVDTASFLFQDNFSGRAEIGLAGDDDFHFKVSPDGSTWNEGIAIDKDSGAVSFPSGVSAPPQPDSLTAFDRIYIDPVAGDDANDGLTAGTALKTAGELANHFTVGRKLEIRLLNDITWDNVLTIGYVVQQLSIFGRTADDSGYESRKITVVDATNSSSHPGGFLFQSFTSVYMFRIDVDLNTSRTNAFLNFLNTIGFLRTHTMTLRRLGSGQAVLFANGSSFVPSQHTTFTIDVTAAGYVARGVASGIDPNTDWRYPSNVTSF